MTRNVGNLDRLIRFIAGVVLIALPFVSDLPLFSGGVATIVAVVVGLVLIATAAKRFCPAYRLLGMKTCRV